MSRKLSAMQIAFVAACAQHGPGEEAARAAGYRKPVQAVRRLLANPAVRRALGLEPLPAPSRQVKTDPEEAAGDDAQNPAPNQEPQRRVGRRVRVTQDEPVCEDSSVQKQTVIQGLLAEAQREGPGTTHSARVRAWTELGRHLGMFSEQANPDGDQVEVIYLAPEQYRSVEEWEQDTPSESDPNPDHKPN